MDPSWEDWSLHQNWMYILDLNVWPKDWRLMLPNVTHSKRRKICSLKLQPGNSNFATESWWTRRFVQKWYHKTAISMGKKKHGTPALFIVDTSCSEWAKGKVRQCRDNQNAHRTSTINYHINHLNIIKIITTYFWRPSPGRWGQNNAQEKDLHNAGVFLVKQIAYSCLFMLIHHESNKI